MAKRTVPRRTKRALTVWDGDKYFDATFTSKERSELRDKLMDICGYGSTPRIPFGNFTGFEFEIERPAEDVVWPVFTRQGLTYDRNRDKLSDYALIHICRELGVDYHAFAAYVPRLPIEGFIAYAKRCFPDFKIARNKIERTIQEHKLHLAWVDWMPDECTRNGCEADSHWLCHDRFEERDYPTILLEIAKHNETRPKFAPPKLVYSADDASTQTAREVAP